MPQSEVSSPSTDILGNRTRFVLFGLAAVELASLAFAVQRFVVSWQTGAPTPWWINLGVAVGCALVYLWFRVDPERRSPGAVHATAALGVVSLLVPIAYGMTSSIWWVSLIGFAVMLMARPWEGRAWAVCVVLIVLLGSVFETYLQIDDAPGETTIERVFARVGFVLILLGVAGGFRHVVEQRNLELVRSAEALKQANATKSRFLGHVSHELRTPLHGVIAMTDLALQQDLDESTRTQIRTAHASAKVLLRLLEDLLDVTRAEHDALVLEPRPFSLHTHLSEVLQPLTALAKGKGLELSAQADPGVIESRVGDPVRVGQILLNLVSNAIKFTQHGQVAVELRGDDNDPELIELRVSDTGRGVPVAMSERIFEPFTQVESSDAVVLGGAGIGLAVVRELAKRMGGSVSIANGESGQGSRFSVRLRLPVSEGAAAAGPEDLLSFRVEQPSAPPANGATLRVLIVEDNPVNSTVMETILDRLGHDHSLAIDGEDAWQLLQSESFDVVLSDVQMPRCDGYELVRRIRAREAPGQARLAVVAVTASAHAEEREKLLAAGMSDFLSKPFTTAMLRELLQRLRAGA